MNRVIPYVGGHRGAPALLPRGGRLVKTHDLASGPCRRAIYLARDGRAVALAEYRWWVRGGLKEDFGTFLQGWLAGQRSIFGRWDEHVSYWLGSDIATQGDLLVVRYEDLRTITHDTLIAILDFLSAQVPEHVINQAIADNDLQGTREKEQRAASIDVRDHGGPERFVGTGDIATWRRRLTREQRRAIERIAQGALVQLEYGVHDETSGISDEPT